MGFRIFQSGRACSSLPRQLLMQKHVQESVERISGSECGLITGNTPDRERAQLIARFKGEPVAANLFNDTKPPLKYLVNVNVLTTGFDAPNVDCVVLLRPTASPGLYYQMVGRGFRLHPNKQNCLVLDFGGNILRHGPVDDIRVAEGSSGNGQAPAKECPECQSVIHAAYARCPDCGYQFSPPNRQKHDDKASEEGILSGQVTDTEYEVRDVTYSVHTKRGADEDAPKTMRVDYRLGLDHWQSEWICFEHTGFARRKAEVWWRKRSPDPVPATAERAVEIAEGGGVAIAEAITVRSVTGEKYDRIVEYKLGPVPEAVLSNGFAGYDPEDIPF